MYRPRPLARMARLVAWRRWAIAGAAALAVLVLVLAPAIEAKVVDDHYDAPDGFADIADLAPGIVVDMRYATAQNFLGRRVRGYTLGRCFLTQAAAEALAAVARDLAAKKLTLMVYDCYRPLSAVADFVAWGRDLRDTTTQAVHYPATPKSELFKRGYIASHSAHSRGSTVDLTLIPLSRPPPPPPMRATPVEERDSTDCRDVSARFAPDGSLDMGTTFDCFDDLAHTDDPRVSPAARQNRALLRSAMERRGFVNYPKEWWHFTLANEPYPSTSFDFEVR